MCGYTQFRRFLKDTDCEREFEEAFESQYPGYQFDVALWTILGGDEFFLGRAFDWSHTKEGRAFWEEIDRQWYRRVSRHRI